MSSPDELVLRSRGKRVKGCPFIVQLQGGCGPPAEGAPAQLVTEKNADNADGSARIKAAACWDDTVRWGEEYNDEGVTQVLIARNRLTGKVRLIEIGSISMQPIVPLNDRTRSEVDSIIDAKLNETFGSKKQKRYYEQAKKNKIDVDTLKGQLEETALKINVSTTQVTDTPTAENMTESYIPPIDRDAIDAKCVYKLDKILTVEERDELKPLCEQLFAQKSEEIVVSDFMKKYVLRLKNDTSPNKINNCMALLYADCILAYLNCDYKKARNINCVICPYSALINKSILNSFSVKNDKSRNRPKNLKDKAMCYIIVLLLISSNLIFSDYDELREVLHIPGPKLSQLVKVVGARTIPVDGSNSIILKLPLVAPPSVNLKREKK